MLIMGLPLAIVIVIDQVQGEPALIPSGDARSPVSHNDIERPLACALTLQSQRGWVMVRNLGPYCNSPPGGML